MSNRPKFVAATLLAATTVAAAVVLMSAPPGVAASTATPTATPPTIGTSPSLPNAPIDLHVAAVTSTSVTLAWTAPAPTSASVAGYTISYTQAFNDIYWQQQVGTVTTVTITANIAPTRQYSFSVATRDTLGHTGAAAYVSGVVTPASDTASDQSPPSAPGNLRVAAVTAAGTELTWTASTDNVGVTGYQVYRFDGLYVSTLVGTTTATTLTVPASATPIGSWYVRAADAAGNLSAASNTATAPTTTTPTTPPVPTCRVTYRNTSEWSTGFVADVTVTSTTAVDGWTLVLVLGGDQRLTQAWNASFSQSGSTVTLTPAGWNRRIPAGGSVSAGLLGSWRTSNAPPAQAALNGASCVVS
jgi:cellulose binding protein with CBM2 domain/fibronectin type III domain protein